MAHNCYDRVMDQDPNIQARKLASQLNIKWDERCVVKNKITRKYLERVLGALLALELKSQENVARHICEMQEIDWDDGFMNIDGTIKDSFFENVLNSLIRPPDLSALLAQMNRQQGL